MLITLSPDQSRQMLADRELQRKQSHQQHRPAPVAKAAPAPAQDPFAEIRRQAVLAERELQVLKSQPESVDKWQKLWGMDAELRAEFSSREAYLACMHHDHPSVAGAARAAGDPSPSPTTESADPPATGRGAGSGVRGVFAEANGGAAFDYLVQSPTAASKLAEYEAQWAADRAVREEFSSKEAFLAAMLAPVRAGC